ncbi:MAG: GntR family transcriptional regulator [Longimicrobiales bacterium]
MEPHRIAPRLAARLADAPGEPASHVIVEDVWLAVVDGSLESGERLPTARQLSVALGVSPRTIERAYTELERRGVIATRAGEGTFVSLAPPPEAEHARRRELAALCREIIERARALDFGVDELLDALAAYGTLDAGPARGKDE